MIRYEGQCVCCVDDLGPFLECMRHGSRQRLMSLCDWVVTSSWKTGYHCYQVWVPPDLDQLRFVKACGTLFAALTKTQWHVYHHYNNHLILNMATKRRRHAKAVVVDIWFIELDDYGEIFENLSSQENVMVLDFH